MPERQRAWRAFVAATAAAWAPGAALVVVTLDALLTGHRLVPGVGPTPLVVLSVAALAGPASRGVAATVDELRRLRPATRLERTGRPATVRGERVVVVDTPAFVAYCRGLVRPRIVVSTGAVARLDGAALAAVLAHERHHARHRDPLRLLWARVVTRSAPRNEALGRARTRFERAAEIAADRAAVTEQADTAPLARALLSIAMLDLVEAFRVDALTGQTQTSGPLVDWVRPLAAATVALAVLAVAAAGGHGLPEAVGAVMGS